MENIRKHLNIIKLALELNDELIVAHELLKLDIKEPNLAKLRKLLAQKAKNEAISLIDLLINTNVQDFANSEFYELTQRYKNLQEIYAELLEEKEAILSSFDDFEREYYMKFSDVLREILTLQRRLAENALNDIMGNKIEQQSILDEINVQENELKGQFKHKKAYKIKLSNEEQNELKMLYRKGVKLCHPDAIGSNKKIIFYDRLNKAYQNNDLKQLKDIILELEKDEKTAKSDDKTKLKTNISKLERMIELVKDEIDTLKNKTHFKTAINKASWDEFFKKERTILWVELENLKDEIKNLR